MAGVKLNPKLLPKQEIFVREMLAHGDEKIALEKAGYKFGRQAAARLISGSRAVEMALIEGRSKQGVNGG